jgi:hypothetical protein
LIPFIGLPMSTRASKRPEGLARGAGVVTGAAKGAAMGTFAVRRRVGCDMLFGF